MTKRDLLRAARVIERYASEIEDSETVSGMWPKTVEATTARREVDSYMALAERLRELAKCS